MKNVCKMIKKFALNALKWVGWIALKPWKNIKSVDLRWYNPVSMEHEAYRMMVNRGLSIQHEMNSRLDEAESILNQNALSIVSSQPELNEKVQKKCWKILGKCMRRKESINFYTLTMFDYLFELRNIILQIEYIDSFYTINGEDVILDKDESAEKALNISYEYEMQHNLKSYVYDSIYFKYGISEFDDFWVYNKSQAINENKACSLIDYCLHEFDIIVQKFPISLSRINILHKIADLISKSELSNNEMSILATIKDNYNNFQTRKSPFEGENTFFDIDYKNLNKDIKKKYLKIAKSKTPSLPPLYFPPKKFTTLEKVSMYIENHAVKFYKFLTKIEPLPIIPIRNSKLELKDFINKQYNTTAYFPPNLSQYLLLYDKKLETSNGNLRLEIHFFKEAKVFLDNKLILTFSDFYLNSKKIFDEIGWNLDDISSFSFTNLSSEDPPCVQIFIEYSPENDTLVDFKEVSGAQYSHIVTLKTPAAINKILPESNLS